MEESLLKAENNLREECFDMLKNRLNQTKECIVFFHFVLLIGRRRERSRWLSMRRLCAAFMPTWESLSIMLRTIWTS